MNPGIQKILKQVQALPSDWHGAGTLGAGALAAIARYALGIGHVARSVETGSGRTTLLLSHLSRRHTVFALNVGGSVARVLESPLLNRETVDIVEGPTQATLPTYRFDQKLQIALIDGPHGYPFPDLEYYFLYPAIDAGGILVIDDVLIPSIRRMVDIVGAGEMFELLEVVDANTAFLRRTTSPAIDPMGDDWWLQGYNRAHYKKISRPPSIVQKLARNSPLWLKSIVPHSIRTWLRRNL